MNFLLATALCWRATGVNVIPPASGLDRFMRGDNTSIKKDLKFLLSKPICGVLDEAPEVYIEGKYVCA